MKCEKCGKEIDSIEVNMFESDGSNGWHTVEIGKENDVIFFNIEAEQIETIRCPHCHKFPLKKQTLIYASFKEE